MLDLTRGTQTQNVSVDGGGVRIHPVHLHKDDQDGALVLGHELLLLVCNRCRPEERVPLHGCNPTGQAACLLISNPGARNAGARHHAAGAPSMGSV